MDRTVPASAAVLLDFIRKVETGKADASAYDVIYAHRQGALPKPITQMTVAELQHHQSGGRWPAKSTAAGGYQFMKATLGDLRKELKLRDGQIFDADLQDRLGYHLLKRRGFEQFITGKLSLEAFGNNLAKEWASLPVLTDIRGAHRNIKAGETYYAGDKLNKALVPVARVQAVLSEALNEVDRQPAPKPAPIPTVPFPDPPKRGIPGWVIFLFIALALAGAFFLFAPIVSKG